MPKIIAYLRISTNKQELDNQKLAIMNYAYSQKFIIDEFVKIQASSRLTQNKRKINILLEKLNKGDTLIVSELSRLARSLGQILQIIDRLINDKIKFISLKENIILDGKHNIQSKVMITMFGLFAEIERDLISERTKEGLKAAKEKGKILGRPKGAVGKETILDNEVQQIKRMLDKNFSKTAIAKVLEVSRTTLNYFIKSRKLQQ